MSVYIAVGSNIGDRLNYLNRAIEEIKKNGLVITRIAPIYETPALLPAKAPNNIEWERPFLNTVLELTMNQSDITPKKLLTILQSIEIQLGRKKTYKWAPRTIDLDILLFNNDLIKEMPVSSGYLTIPHRELTNRNFVLTPLKELATNLQIPNSEKTVLNLFRQLKIKIPTWMHIVNITPDSFSDGGQMNLKQFKILLKTSSVYDLHILDLGAESTRPGATPIMPETEWNRLEPFINCFFNYYHGQSFRPRLSIDTRHPQTARQAIAKGIDMINDVSGLSKEMLNVLTSSNVEYVLTHSLSVPANKHKTLSEQKNPIAEIKKWLEQKLEILDKHNISLNRIIFDPGIGFGKTASQSLYILRNIKEFFNLPVRIMVGHSRKSFMKFLTSEIPNDRDPASIGISLALAKNGVDILRVHKAHQHTHALQGYLTSLNSTVKELL